MKNLTLTAIAVLSPLAALAADTAPVVSDAFAISTNPRSGAVYMSIANPTAETCTLQGASTEAAESVSLHTHTEEAGVMKMSERPPIAIAAGGTHELARSGDHVMLMGLTAPLAVGDHVALTLDFGNCGQVKVDVPVVPVTGGKTDAADHSHHHTHG